MHTFICTCKRSLTCLRNNIKGKVSPDVDVPGQNLEIRRCWIQGFQGGRVCHVASKQMQIHVRQKKKFNDNGNYMFVRYWSCTPQTELKKCVYILACGRSVGLCCLYLLIQVHRVNVFDISVSLELKLHVLLHERKMYITQFSCIT